MSAPSRTVTAEDIRRARVAIADGVEHTPALPSLTLTDRLGGEIVLKAENLQRTGSFKIRGALSKLAGLGDACARGVTAGSAGNHGWGVSLAAQIRGAPCEVFMPAEAPLAKVEGCRALGAIVRLGGDVIEECLSAARARAQETGMTFVHPFEDPDVIAGQGTIGLELLEDVEDLAKVVVPLGGGGLASGIAIAVKSVRSEIEVVGVQVDSVAPYLASLQRGEPVEVSPGLTIADGIAVKRPGELTLGLVREWLDDVVTVSDDEVAEAMVLLMEKAKLVVEGAGAVGAAALLGGQTAPAPNGTTVVILSGGNVDAGLLASIARRHETLAGRRLVIFTRVADRPGSLARLLSLLGGAGANLVDVEHLREGLDLHVRETGVQLVLETKGREHAAEVLANARDAGYDVQVVSAD